LFTASYTGDERGFVVITADDPSAASLRMKQDTPLRAFRQNTMLEPATGQEPKIHKIGIPGSSEQFDTQCFLVRPPDFQFKIRCDIVGPRITEDHRHPIRCGKNSSCSDECEKRGGLSLKKRMQDLRGFAETFSENRVEINNTDVGIITAGMP